LRITAGTETSGSVMSGFLKWWVAMQCSVRIVAPKVVQRVFNVVKPGLEIAATMP